MRTMPGPSGGLHLLLGLAGFVGTLMLIAIIAAVIIYLVKRKKGTLGTPGFPLRHPGLPPAMQILDDRLARGDIDIEDYLNRKAALLGEVPKPNEWTPAPDPTQTATDQPTAG
jgi:uncharacterized membrane protein